MVPISLYVTIELVKLGQVYFINNDIGPQPMSVGVNPSCADLYYAPTDTRMLCRALNITEDLGQARRLRSLRPSRCADPVHSLGQDGHADAECDGVPEVQSQRHRVRSPAARRRADPAAAYRHRQCR